jgi:HAD superfamily hydrolase (TIGR01509 family)
MKNMWSAIARELTGNPLDDEYLNYLQDLFETDFSDQIEPLDTVIQTLDSLKEMQMPVGIISDGDAAWQMHKLELSGLRKYFADEAINISIQSDLPACKPSSRNYRLHEQRTDLKGRELLYIGDKPWDIIGANNSGWTSVLTTQAWKDRDNHWPEPELELEKPDYTVEKMEQLLEVLISEQT